MKYRRLSLGELSELEPEFINFLSAHSIPAEDWEKIKKDQPEKAEEWVERFSDFVFEKILTDIDFLQKKERQIIQIVKVSEPPFQMRGLRVVGNDHINFLKDEQPSSWNQSLRKHGGKIKVFRAEKQLEKDQSVNMHKFQLMEQGFLILKDPHLYKVLEDLQSQFLDSDKSQTFN